MPISATGTSTRDGNSQRQAAAGGFSLLELLVVVAIVGIFLGVAVLSTDLVSYERKLEREAQNLATRLRFTSEEALMQSRDYGILFYAEGYEFLMFEPGQGWLPTGGAGMEDLRLEQGMTMRLFIEDREIVLDPQCVVLECDNGAGSAGTDEATEGDTAERTPTPQIMIYSSGEMTPFDIEFRRESPVTEPGYLLDVAFDGKTEVSQSGA